MSSSLLASATSMTANDRAQEIIARNLANVSTTGYRKGVPIFEGFSDALLSANSNVVPTMVAGSEEYVDFGEGSHTHTGSELDFAIEGDGFFVLQHPEQPERPMYTRKGHFTLNSQGELVNSAGLKVLDDSGGTIKLPPGGGALVVSQDGAITYKHPVTGNIPLGKLMIVDFNKPYTLERTNFTAFVEQEGSQSAQPAEEAKVRQGYIEEANVNLITELVSMITVMRNFEANQRVISVTNETLKNLIDSA